MNYTAWGFAIAGLVCAAVPIIIHLLNRRRYRTVQWAAMDFLREALQRNRRIMQLRDLLLLALRVAAVALFGLALSRPYWAAQEEEFDPKQPLHAVLVVDNSMSMGYEEQLDSTLLDRAKERAEQFMRELPPGSRITVVPLCGSSQSYSLEPYRSVDDAVEALDEIEVVDRGASMAGAASLAQQAAEHSEPQLAKRLVVFSDQQRDNWRGSLNPVQLRDLPEMQVVDVSAAGREDAIEAATSNSWIADFRLVDSIADIESMAHFEVVLRHDGKHARENIELSLWCNGERVNGEAVTLQPGTGDQAFKFTYNFASSDIDLEPGQQTWAAMKVTLAVDDQDRLAADNERHLVVPVVSSLPVVFVDDVGSQQEQREDSQEGETAQLRKYLNPRTNRDEDTTHLVRVDHCTIDELDQDRLTHARLVVIAGIEGPGDKVELLRQYVQQGGQLLIAAGGKFDPTQWTDDAWQDGGGILPAPLRAEFHGALPDEPGAKFDWLELAWDDAMRGQAMFQFAGESQAAHADFYGIPYFYKAALIDDLDPAREAVSKFETSRIIDTEKLLAEIKQRKANFQEIEERGGLTEEQRAQLAKDEQLSQQAAPTWLAWAGDSQAEEVELPSDEAERDQHIARVVRGMEPQVMANFNNGEPFLVERRIGNGRVVLATSGLKPEWNNVAKEDSILIYGRLVRGMLQSTTPPRNFLAQDRIVLPVGRDLGELSYHLKRPGDDAAEEELAIGFLGANKRGLEVSNPLRQGVYTITAYETSTGSDGERVQEEKWTMPLAVNVGSASGSESELAPLTQDDFDEKVAEAVGDSPAENQVGVVWVADGETISLSGKSRKGQNLWAWLIFVVLVLLLVEIAVLAWPALTAPPQPQTQTTPRVAAQSAA